MVDIRVSGLVKSFDLEKRILDGLSFQVDSGERVGLLGRNGAGKTTVFRMLTGELEPDERLPAVREVAKQFGINPNTVQKSYSQLEQAGLIYSIPAKGSYVSGGGDAAEAVRKEAVRKAGRELRSAYDAGVSLAEIESLARQIWSGEAGEAGEGGEIGETGERTGGNQ
mgnify:CR=1 FL=1